jgi:3-phosphoshikimate 1-carboxyvinyltransferase
LDLVNSGTSLRFLAGLLAAGTGEYILDGNARMRERPVGDLLDALRALGVNVRSERENGCPPIRLSAAGITGGRTTIRGDVSSQFLSALLMAAPLARGPLRIEVAGELVSKPYIDMTLQTMAAFGVVVRREGVAAFEASPSRYASCDYTVEPDASAASYWFAAAAIAGGRVTVPGLGSDSLQGDLGFVRILERMGCRVVQTRNSTTVEGGPLHGVDAEMGDLSDTVPTLAAVAVFADGPTTIRGVANIRVKECDRLAAVATELRKLGADVEEGSDRLRIQPRPLHGARLATYDDHRMAMSLALVGLRVPGVQIENPGCVAKTYPNYWRDFARLVGRPE